MQATSIDQLLTRKDVLFVANHSGGKDSQATLIHLLKAGIDKSQIVVVHASLGDAEWPGALEKAREHAEKNGLPFFVARASKTIFDMVENRYKTRPSVPSFPSSSTRQCTSDLKRDPVAKVVRNYAAEHGFNTVVNCLGIRALESTARSKKNPFQINPRFCTQTRTWFEWFPIFELTVDEVKASIAAAGETLHYAYSLGNDRLSCVFCIMASEGDLKCGAKHNPELLNRYVALEEKTGYTMHASRKSLLEIIFGDTLELAA